MAQDDLNEKEIQALRLVNCGTGMRLTHLGNTLVSRQAKNLKAKGYITEAPETWIAYEPTSKGRAWLAANPMPERS